MKHMVMALMEQYGYATIFASMMLGIIGVPLPDEFILFFAGSLAGAARINMFLLVAAAWAGSSLGMSVNFYLGHKIGLKRISKLTKWIHMPEERLAKWAEQFQRRGPWFIFIGFYVAGLRHASPFIAGASGMRFRRFAVYAFAGSLLWISIFVGLGVRFRNEWHRVSAITHHPLLAASVCLAILGVYVIRKWKVSGKAVKLSEGNR